jgi:hypothetical protein
VELSNYFSVLPAFKGLYKKIEYRYDHLVSDAVTNPYVSARETPMNKLELRNFLVDNRLLSVPSVHEQALPARRYWPGDKEEN